MQKIHFRNTANMSHFNTKLEKTDDVSEDEMFLNGAQPQQSFPLILVESKNQKISCKIQLPKIYSCFCMTTIVPL